MSKRAIAGIGRRRHRLHEAVVEARSEVERLKASHAAWLREREENPTKPTLIADVPHGFHIPGFGHAVAFGCTEVRS